jgi:hypothetical protein
MSKGAGAVERRIADLLAATRDRALTVDDITDAAFELRGAKPTRAQRLSATGAASTRLTFRCGCGQCPSVRAVSHGPRPRSSR